MNVRYKREMCHNYMILEALEEEGESYEFKMLTENSIEGLLRFRVKQEEQGRYYYYEITSKQPLSRLLEFKEIRKEELSKLILGIGTALDHMEDHLLQEASLLLEPEHIYIGPENYQVWLCYVPGYQGDLPSAMGRLLQFLLKKADHKDNATVVLAYRLYQESQKDYYGIADLIKAVRESQHGGGQDGLWQEPGPEVILADRPMFSGGRPGKERAEEILPKKKGPGEELPRKKGRGEELPEKIGQGEALLERKRWREDLQEEGDKGAALSEEWAGEVRSYAKDKKSIRQRTKFVVLSLLSFFTVVPAAIWLFAGPAGLSRYKLYIAAADVAVAAGTLALSAILKARTTDATNGLERVWGNGPRSEKEQGELQEKWYMHFADEEDGAEDERNMEEPEGPEPAYTIPGPERLGGNGTVLLAEASVSGERPHLLKSLDPSVEDIPILYFPFIIGKQEGIVDYVLKKDTVSRLHLKLDEEEGGCRVTDLNSSNGTVVAGHSLEANGSERICSGDKLQIADLSFVFY